MAYKRRKDFEQARDRLFQEIHRCDVIGAEEEDVTRWLDDTVEYLCERYPSLDYAERNELWQAGANYVAPPVPHGRGKDARNREEWSETPAIT